MTRIDLHKLKPGEHLTGDRLQRYRSGRMSSEERAAADRHLQSCQLCSEAVEGIGRLDTPEQLDRIRRDLHRRVAERLLNPRRLFPEHYLPILLITMVVLAIIVLLGFYMTTRLH